MEQKYLEALKYYGMAAEKGYAEAQYKLAGILLEEGMKYLAACQKQGYSEAASMLVKTEKKLKDLNIANKKAKPKTVQNAVAGLKVKKGEVIKFGSYPQTQGGKSQPIEWQVLAVKENKALLISKYGLDAQPFNEEAAYVTWDECTLRNWLNNDFYNKAFNSNEASVIEETYVKAEKNPKYNSYQGNDTRDKVFLLNIQEANNYFKDDEARKCYSTEYAVKHGAYKNDKGRCYWWLRSSGGYSNLAAFVTCGGWVDGYFVDDDDIAVRPALWINL